MPKYIAALSLILVIGSVLARVAVMKARGASAMKFGRQDRRDFFIIPFALFYIYMVLGNAFAWPMPSPERIFVSAGAAWLGAAFCLLGLAFFYWTLLSFGESFRVGIDADAPAPLVTWGAFSLSRNPIYVAFLLILLGELLVFSDWILLVYLFAAAWLINRQVRLEEDFLRSRYGTEYEAYRAKVARYL